MKKPSTSLTTKFFFAIVCIFALQKIEAQCAANFNIITGPSGGVTFSNTSTGTTTNTTYYYVFGNGQNSIPSTNPNGSTTYTTNQVYSVTLNIADSTNNCFANITKTVSITNAGCNANLVISNSNFANGLVNFSNNMQTGAGSFSWNFGDNTTSSLSNPAHTYTAGGVYNVSLTFITPMSVCTYTAVKTITVTVSPCGLTASFTYTNVGNGMVNFASTSTGTTSLTSYYWTFGDGSSAYIANPSHTYLSNSSFPVNLVVTDSANFFCTGNNTQTVTITNALCPNNTSFSISKDSSQAFTWNAYPTYPGNISGVTWNWGDGSSSNLLYPTHTYSAAGVYTICLSGTVSCGTSTMTCIGSSIYRPAGGGGSPEMITVRAVDPSNPLSVKGIETAAQHINIFPNPSTGDIGLQLKGAKAGTEINVQVFSMLGNLVFEQKFSANEQDHKLELAKLENGIYLVTVKGDSMNHSDRIVIQK